jgi:hypothetical protein
MERTHKQRCDKSAFVYGSSVMVYTNSDSCVFSLDPGKSFALSGQGFRYIRARVSLDPGKHKRVPSDAS